MTGYQYTKKVVNPTLAAYELKGIPAQMVYQYLSKGWIPFIDADGQRTVDVDAADAWLQKYIARRLEKAKQA